MMANRGKPAANNAADSAAWLGNVTDGWQCQVCGYIYRAATGDPAAGYPPGTPFAALAAGWICPVCGAGKPLFEPLAAPGQRQAEQR